MSGIWYVVAALLALWILGVAFKLFGALIHFVLVVAIVLCVISLIGRRISR